MVASHQFEADLRELESIRRFVETAARDEMVDPQVLADMLVVVTEAATNSIEHGYCGFPGMLEVEVRFDGDDLSVVIRDDGLEFDPNLVRADDQSINLNKPLSGGLGLQIIRRLTDHMNYQCLPDGRNELVLTKKYARITNRE